MIFQNVRLFLRSGTYDGDERVMVRVILESNTSHIRTECMLGGGGSASGSWVLDGSRGFCFLGFFVSDGFAGSCGFCGSLWFLRLFADTKIGFGRGFLLLIQLHFTPIFDQPPPSSFRELVFSQQCR
jgi:hypothetical protein